MSENYDDDSVWETYEPEPGGRYSEGVWRWRDNDGVGESAMRQVVTRNESVFEFVAKRGRERLFRYKLTGDL